MLQFDNIWNKLKSKMKPFLVNNEIIKEEETGNELTQEIEEARKQWVQACNYFENVSEPELIDHASYKIEAARAKYMYLLKKAKDSEEVEIYHG